MLVFYKSANSVFTQTGAIVPLNSVFHDILYKLGLQGTCHVPTRMATIWPIKIRWKRIDKSLFQQSVIWPLAFSPHSCSPAHPDDCSMVTLDEIVLHSVENVKPHGGAEKLWAPVQSGVHMRLGRSSMTDVLGQVMSSHFLWGKCLEWMVLSVIALFC